MSRSQDFKNHFWDELFTEDPVESRLARESEERRQRYLNQQLKYRVERLIMHKPKRMLPILGCVLGDYVGSRFEHDYPEFVDLGDYNLLDPACKFTDDTIFTLGIAEAFVNGEPTPEGFTKYLIKWGRLYPHAGFGRSTQAWIASDDPQPYGSNRNGAAMRVAPCASFANSLDEALEYAKIQAEVSHNSPEGVAGAQAIAAAIYMALQKAPKEEIREYIEKNFGYDLSLTMDDLRKSWSGFSCKASDTVPQAILCFLHSHDVESAIRNGISLCSDADTLAAMAGAIAAAYYEYMPHLWQMLDHTPINILDALSICSHKLREMQ